MGDGGFVGAEILEKVIFEKNRMKNKFQKHLFFFVAELLIIGLVTLVWASFGDYSTQSYKNFCSVSGIIIITLTIITTKIIGDTPGTDRRDFIRSRAFEKYNELVTNEQTSNNFLFGGIIAGLILILIGTLVGKL